MTTKATLNQIIDRLDRKWNLNQRLSEHITLREFLFGTKDHLLKDLIGEEKKYDEAILFATCVERELTNEIVEEAKRTCVCAEIIRAFFGFAIWLTCGFRPVTWEKYRNRTGASMHCLGKAIDFFVMSTSLQKVYDFVDSTFKTGGRAINLIAGFVHFDTRFDNRYWWTYN